MSDTRPPPPNRSRIILGDSSTKKVDFIRKFDLIFHSKTGIPATLDCVSFLPDLEFNRVLFHVVQENRVIILNRSGTHLKDGRLTFFRKENGSYIRATRVSSGQNIGISIALVTF